MQAALLFYKETPIISNPVNVQCSRISHMCINEAFHTYLTENNHNDRIPCPAVTNDMAKIILQRVKICNTG